MARRGKRETDPERDGLSVAWAGITGNIDWIAERARARRGMEKYAREIRRAARRARLMVELPARTEVVELQPRVRKVQRG